MSAPDPAQQRIFVSHSHSDTAYCREYVAGLRARGLYVWYDEHNLGWGALRATIEREMPTCKHFVAILSPAAVASDWVNTEIDAALELLNEGTLQTFTLVIAETCVVPLLLRRWKRIEGSGGAPVSVGEAVAKSAHVAALQGDYPIAQLPALPQSPPPAPSPKFASPQRITLPPDRMPPRLSQLGFTAYRRGNMEYIVPPVCDLPAGPFLMGSDSARDKKLLEDEQPQHSVMLADFQIGRCPVTVAEYSRFVYDGQKEPWNWRQQLSKLDHPVVSVSWPDARAYVNWLSECTGQLWRLPSEEEWEKAARGTDGRIYPWGDTFDASHCNTSESNKGGTTPVGSYPDGASPYGVQDMAGNVWEWTSGVFQRYSYEAISRRKPKNVFEESSQNRVIRGGSWFNLAWVARAACRYTDALNSSNDNKGFRMVLGVLNP